MEGVADVIVNQQGLAMPARLASRKKIAPSPVSLALAPELERQREHSRYGRGKDHMQENVRQMRRKQRELRHKRREEEAAKDAPFRPAKSMYNGKPVESRFRKEHEKLLEEAAQKKKFSYLKRGDGKGQPSSLKKPAIGRPPTSEGAQRPPSSGFGRTNAANRDDGADLGLVIKGTASRPSSAARSRPSTSSRPGSRQRSTRPGEIPKYLQQMRSEKRAAEEKARKKAEDPNCPDGYRRLDRHAQRRAIQQLQQMHTRLSDNLQMLPFSRDTLRLREYREALECDVVELEEAIHHLHTNVVYVPERL
ncbi:hypothetical protein PTSG_12121 [Salpingoeca rosetta]|uniref:Enkurin domain-containing protein n=1 Tax=Salpingoeca rosetta (strain ATCC 50818 / BSB-021) TaxID=946362 RepID=F2U7M5_SALR5|nr:uncharacterized protein PTSG_12121 [Salpingoeca rosetta]EGD83442.1 hypothetical protein PTSG_12121 [Salpingoeca rosetta]|eukprot:XP_004994946.1 hypothetical protein PTSG_12121 [Salpingoeca rosetta]